MFFQNFSWRDPKPDRAAQAEAEHAQSAGRRECPDAVSGRCTETMAGDRNLMRSAAVQIEVDHELSFAGIDTDMCLYHRRLSPLAGDENAPPATETSSGFFRIPPYIRSQALVPQITDRNRRQRCKQRPSHSSRSFRQRKRENSWEFTQSPYSAGLGKDGFLIDASEERSNSANLNSIPGKQRSTLGTPFVSPNP
jgi:hypothetical protein